MSEAEILFSKPQCWRNSEELFELAPPVVEFISDVQKPPLCTLSLTDSICSDLTIEIDGLDKKEEIDSQIQCDMAQVTDHFMGPTVYNSADENAEHVEVSVTCSGNNVNNKFRKFYSLYDVSNFSPLQLTSKSMNTVSCETIHSQSLSSTTKSKDSGIQRSVSCLSFTSGKRNYDHVQSKVKAYIKNIKESEALRKKNKRLQLANELNKSENNETVPPISDVDNNLDKEDLMLKIRELKHELHEKELFIEAQQKSYNGLLLKLAEAKNIIDTLRLQRLSLDYSGLSDSRNLSSRINSINYNIFEQEVNMKTRPDLLNDFGVGKEEAISKEQCHTSIETSNSSLTKSFRPRKHSTPEKIGASKSLSPVSRMFSSSSRLDKHYLPLTNLNHQRNHSTYFHPGINKNSDHLQSPPNSKCQTSTGVMKSKQTALKLNNQNQQRTHIDLPNDDPFEKVKNWQATLPTINLLGTSSSSDCDLSDFGDTCTPSKKTVTNFEKRSHGTQNPEKVIDVDGSLSAELVTKCRIDGMEVDSVPETATFKTGQHFTTKYLSKEMPKASVDFKDRTVGKQTIPINLNRVSASGEPYFETNDNQTINRHVNVQHVKDDLVGNKQMTDLKNTPNHLQTPKLNKHSSVSESESVSYLPKTSSLTFTLDRDLNGNSYTSNDDSSSISSSVLGSDVSLPVCLPFNRSKKRSARVNESLASNKVPRIAHGKTISSNFVLQEPKLNIAFPLANVTNMKSKSPVQNNSTNSTIPNACSFLITESSQRKAWNARNNANFFVCKDFYFKKSSSMEDCLDLMKGMVKESSSIIDSVLDRSNL